MTSPIVADRSGDPPILPRLWRVETHLQTLAGILGDRHRAIADLIAAYGAPQAAVIQLEAALDADRAALRFAAAELQRVRHQLSKVLP
jgi:hypothetical protein